MFVSNLITNLKTNQNEKDSRSKKSTGKKTEISK